MLAISIPMIVWSLSIFFIYLALPNEVDSAATAAATIAAAALASRQQQHQQQQHYQNINQNLQNSGSAFVSLAYASCKLKYDLFIANNFS